MFRLKLFSIQKTKVVSPLCLFMFTTLLFYTIPSYCLFEYVKIETLSGEKFSGEKIAESEERWFWDTNKGAVYFNLFEVKENKPRLYLVRKDSIRTLSSQVFEHSIYKDYLEKQNISLQTTPLNGWNYISTGNDGHHLYENLYGNFAWDIEKRRDGISFQNEGASNQDYYTWEESIYSPIKGTLVDFRFDAEDNLPDPTLKISLKEKGDGNFVLLHINGPFYFVLLHLKKDSLPKNIIRGSTIKVGQYLGKVGNSGTTYVPHLHMSLYYFSESLNRFISVPSFFKNIRVHDFGYQKFYAPLTHQSIISDSLHKPCKKKSPETFKADHPLHNE